MNVVIAGCGDLGCELARRLLTQKSFTVWGLRRNISRLPEGVLPIQGNLCQAGKLGTWPYHIDYVVYSAAPDGPEPSAYHRSYIDGLTHVINRLKQGHSTPKRMFLTSSTGVYHQQNGENVDELSATRPTSHSGKILLQAENLLKEAPFPQTSIRYGGIYGPGRNRLLDRVKSGKGCPETPVIYGNRIHRDDGAALLLHLIERDIAGLPVDDCYVAADHHPTPMHDVLHWLAEQMNVSLNDEHPTPGRGNKRCSNQRLLNSGYQFIYPDYRAGYSALLDADPF